jgi:hypothetical protein
MLILTGLILTLGAVPRNLVVVEVATGTWCQYCPGAAMGCHDLLQNGHPVAIIKNHGSDSYANVYSNARNSFYGVTGYPTAYFDGLNPSVGGSATQSMYSNYLPKVNARMAVASHFTISAVGNANGSNYTAVVTVAKPEADTNTNIKLHAVLTESDIPQVWFNQTTVENVNRLMVPDQNGTVIELATGAQTSVTLNFTVNAAWNIANCEMVFFLQNMTSKEILQGVKYSLAELVGAYPVSHESIDFPDTYLSGSATVPITITNFGSATATGTLTITNPVFTSSANTFSIPPTQSTTVDITFTPTAAQSYTGNLNITSNLYNHPNIDIPLSGLGFTNVAPIAENVFISGPPVLYQAQFGNYTFTDGDGNTEGSSIYKWYRIINDNPVLIDGADQVQYNAVEADLGVPLAFEVTPVDQHGMAGTPVMSAATIPIEPLPAPQNFAGELQPPDTVVLTWQRPAHFEGRGLVGYRLYRDGLTISTMTNPNTLTFTDTYVSTGIHEYWICSMFNEPYMLSEPSPTVTINVGVANDDQVAPVQTSLNVYPNPFATNATISVSSKAGQKLGLTIYNLKGQLVRSYELVADAAGAASTTWDGTDSNGSKVQTGVYYYRLKGAETSLQGKIILMK